MPLYLCVFFDLRTRLFSATCVMLWLLVLACSAQAQMSRTDQMLAYYDCAQGDQNACLDAALAAAVPYQTLEDAQTPLHAMAQTRITEENAACDAGALEACNIHAALSYTLGEIEFAGLYKRYAELCDQNHGPACARLSELFYAVMEDQDGSLAALYSELEADCTNGHQPACSSQAHLNALLPTITPDRALWHDQMNAACEADIARACAQLSYVYSTSGEDHYGVLDPALHASQRSADRKSAMFARRACTLGNPIGCWNLALAYDYGEGVREDWLTAQRYFVKACVGGYLEGCDELNHETYWRTSDTRLRLAPACEEGDFTACLFLAERDNAPILQGKLEGEDLARMQRHKDQMIELCHIGHVAACGYAAHMLHNTFDNSSQAQRYAQAGCTLLDGNSCVVLGSVLQSDVSDPASFRLSAYAYEQACQLKSWSGCNDLGSLYFNAKEQDRDTARAERYFTIACNNNYTVACNNLAIVLKHSAPEKAKQMKAKACKLESQYCE